MPLTGNFDLYYLFVELVAGNLVTAFLLIGLFILIIGVLTKMSMITITYLEILFTATYFTIYYGGFFTAIAVIASLGYAVFEGYRYFREVQS